MPDIWMDVDTALSEVPVNKYPLTDETDFKTIETAITYNQSGMDLVWNFVTTAGAFTQTAVTPTTAGNYDWTNQGKGMYTIEIPASGGASINNDTEGFGWFTGICTGVLAWAGPIIGFRAAALNNAYIDGGDVPDVSVTEWTGTAVASPDTAGYPKVTIKSGTGTGEVSLASGLVTAVHLRKNVAGQRVSFEMGDSSGVLQAGKTVTVTRSLDGAATFSATTGSVVEAGSGAYWFEPSQADTNASAAIYKCSATGCRDTFIHVNFQG